MTKELFGQLLGWLVVTVTAWFIALAFVAYAVADIRPWTWDIQTRGIHLAIQVALIFVYARWNRPTVEE